MVSGTGAATRVENRTGAGSVRGHTEAVECFDEAHEDRVVGASCFDDLVDQRSHGTRLRAAELRDQRQDTASGAPNRLAGDLRKDDDSCAENRNEKARRQEEWFLQVDDRVVCCHAETSRGALRALPPGAHPSAGHGAKTTERAYVHRWYPGPRASMRGVQVSRYAVKRLVLTPRTAYRRRRSRGLEPFARQLLETQLYGRAMYDFMDAVAANPDLLTDAPITERGVAVDLGAYVGGWATRMSERYGCTVYAFEPSPGPAAKAADALRVASRR